MEYQEFLKQKYRSVTASGFEVAPGDINPKLFLFQADIVRWALRLGRAAIFAECGMGKTPMQLEWARHVAKHTGGKVLVLAPLAVASQTVREGDKFSIEIKHVREPEDIGESPIVITNYERLHLFDASLFSGVVLDESSILKNYTGKTKQQILESFADTSYKLACTATPAPNDHLELGNHSQFLDVMPSHEMIARWFINDTSKAGNYRLKGHAEADFWRWLTSWAVCISKPGDLGAAYEMAGFDLPALNVHQHILSAAQASIERAHSNGRLLPDTNPSSTTLHKVKRESLADRVAKVVELLSPLDSDEPVVIWCDTNYEADALRQAIPDALEVRGSDSLNAKEDRLQAFTEGRAKRLITKPDIAGFGLNWQHCHTSIYAGVGFSFEKLYQSLKRMHRYGQTKPVDAHLIYAETEGSVQAALDHKQEVFEDMQGKMNNAMHEHGLFRDDQRLKLTMPDSRVESGRGWEFHLGDCVPFTEHYNGPYVDFSVYSPPFASTYLYSSMEADMGNCEDTDEFLKHYRYMVKHLFRMTRPGRLTAVHVKDLPIYKNSGEWFGIEDFSGYVRDVHLEAGWIFHSRITIWKDPVREMQKTNSHGLLHKNFAQRAQVVRTGLPDYLLVFAKPDPEGMGENVRQLRQPGDYVGTNPPSEASYAYDTRPAPEYYPGNGQQYNYSIAVWQKYASPVWFDIDQTKVLNYQIAKTDKDEKHMAPLQLQVIARAVDLWTNPGDLVFSPFGGIGSEGHETLLLKRRFLGIELKPEYYKIGLQNLHSAEQTANSLTLWDWAEQQANSDTNNEEA